MLKKVDDIRIECEAENEVKIIGEQVNFYKTEVNKLLIEFRDTE